MIIEHVMKCRLEKFSNKLIQPCNELTHGTYYLLGSLKHFLRLIYCFKKVQNAEPVVCYASCFYILLFLMDCDVSAFYTKMAFLLVEVSQLKRKFLGNIFLRSF